MIGADSSPEQEILANRLTKRRLARAKEEGSADWKGTFARPRSNVELNEAAAGMGARGRPMGKKAWGESQEMELRLVGLETSGVWGARIVGGGADRDTGDAD